MKVVDKESETSYYGNDSKRGGKASVSLGVGWMKHKLESRQLGEISITSDMQRTVHLWQKMKN